MVKHDIFKDAVFTITVKGLNTFKMQGHPIFRDAMKIREKHKILRFL